MSHSDPTFARQLAWLGDCPEDQIQRRAEDELDRGRTRSGRALLGVMLIVALLYLLAWTSAGAATVNLTCTAPTTNTNGSQITATLAYRAYWGTSATTLTNGVVLAGPGCKGSVSVPDATAGQSIQYHFAVTATANGQESVKSNVASKTVSTPLPAPNPPTLLTVSDVGYQLNLGTKNKISLSRVASVPLRKPCTAMSATDPLRTVYLIQDRLWAVMDPNPKKPGEFFTRPNQVWAKCEPS